VTFVSFNKQGLSKQYRKLLMNRHISFCILTLFCQLTGTLYYGQVIGHYTLPGWLEAFCVYYSVSVFILLSLLRLHEPVVWATFKRDVMRLCCRCRANENQGHQSGSSLLSSDSSSEWLRE